MLGSYNLYPTLAVKDLASAKQFYESVLGLSVLEENPYEIHFKSGNGQVFVYLSEYAGTNKATAATWEVTDIDALVGKLKAKGVIFEHYDDMGGVTRKGDVHYMGDDKAAWFKDRDGNILCIHTG